MRHLSSLLPRVLINIDITLYYVAAQELEEITTYVKASRIEIGSGGDSAKALALARVGVLSRLARWGEQKCPQPPGQV